MSENSQIEVIQWAQSLFALPTFCILDTETTGLDDNAEIVEIAIIDKEERTLINQLVKPTQRIPRNQGVRVIDFDSGKQSI